MAKRIVSNNMEIRKSEIFPVKSGQIPCDLALLIKAARVHVVIAALMTLAEVVEMGMMDLDCKGLLHEFAEDMLSNPCDRVQVPPLTVKGFVFFLLQ